MNHKASVEQVRVEDLHKSYGDHEVLKGSRSPRTRAT